MIYDSSEKEEEGNLIVLEKGNSPDKPPSQIQSEAYWNNRFVELVKPHPGASGYPTMKWEAAFLELNELDRQAAFNHHPAFVSKLRSDSIKFPPPLGSYFKDRLFEGFERSVKLMPTIPIKPYSRDWLAHRFWLLAQGATGIFKPTLIHQKVMDAGRSDIVLRDRLLAEYRDVG